MKAWRTELWGIPGIVRAETRSKARAATIRAARGAGFDVAYTAAIRVTRSPDHDNMVALEPGKVWSTEWIAAALEREP